MPKHLANMKKGKEELNVGHGKSEKEKRWYGKSREWVREKVICFSFALKENSDVQPVELFCFLFTLFWPKKKLQEQICMIQIELFQATFGKKGWKIDHWGNYLLL